MSVICMHNPRKIAFGPGCIDQMLEDYYVSGGKRLFILSIEPVVSKLKNQFISLQEKGVEIRINLSVQAEPTFSDFENILAEARDFMPDTVAGIGGGSVMDLAKLIAVFITFNKPVIDFVGAGTLTERNTRLLCVPTTSGTGSEVSPNSILLDASDHIKKAFISPFLVPDKAYIDPSLTLGLSKVVTAYTGIDALTHCIEAYTNKYSHPITDTIALKGISLICKNLFRAVENLDELQPRINLALGSLYGGMCLGPVNTAAVHALAYPLAGHYQLPHGLSNALMLTSVMEFNLDAAEEKYAEIALAAGVTSTFTQRILAVKGIGLIKKLITDCGLPGDLLDTGIQFSSIEKLAMEAMNMQRLLKNNIKEVTLKDAIEIYQRAF
jgi:alcohol dehydrogenase class IV